MFPDLHNALITGGSFVHTVQGNTTGLLSEGFKILHKHIASGAMHNSGDTVFDQPKCHPKTRIVVLRTIMKWVQSMDDQPSSSMLWLYGSTGSGKTAIARSIAEHSEELGLLVATFFFSRTAQGHNDNTTKQFISTIAYQLAQTIPSTLQYIERAVEKDPSIFDKTLKHQVQTLIVQPLKLSNNLSKTSLPLLNPSLLIIDGLDECSDDALIHIQVLKILGSLLLQHQLPLKILITSRPERHIRSAFETGSLNKLSTKLALDDSFDDIRLFLSSEFDEIKESHPFRSTLPKSWPSSSVIELLVKKSTGQFKFAATVIKFVSSFDHPPHERLKDVLTFCDNCTTSRILELLDERPVPPRTLDLSDLPNSHVSESFSFLSTSDIKDPLLPLRRRSASPFPSHLLSNTEEFQRAFSEPSFDRTVGLYRSTSRRIKHSAGTHSCPIPGCGAIFTRFLNFKVHLRTHKEEKKNNNHHSRYTSSSSSSSSSPGRNKAFVEPQLSRRQRLEYDQPPSDHHFQSFECMGCRRQFPQMDSLDRHLKSEIGVKCMKATVIESCKEARDVGVPFTPSGRSHCWEIEMDTAMEVEAEKGGMMGTMEMEVD